jgi:hypothetical protein
VSFEEGLHVLGWDEPNIMAKSLELPADVVGARTGLHADQAGRDVRKPLSELSAGELDPQHDGPALILAHEMEGVLAQINAEGGNHSRRGKP